MTTGPETTKYHIAASELSGTRVAARAFGATGVDFEQPAQINVFNINAPGSQNAANLEALAYSDMGAPLSFSSGAATLIQNLQKEEEEKKEREERSFQSLLDQIDANIAALERRLDDLYKQRDELYRQRDEIREKMAAVDALMALESLDNVDPTNPEHQRLLRKAGFTNPDQWGTLTMDDYRRRRQELEGDEQQNGAQIDNNANQISQTQTQLSIMREQREVAQRAADDPSDNDINVNGLGLDNEIARRQETHPGFDPEHATRADVQQLVTDNVAQGIQLREQVYLTSAPDFAEQLSRLRVAGDDTDSAIAGLVNNLQDNVARTLLTEEGLDERTENYLEARIFMDTYRAQIGENAASGSAIASALVQNMDETVKAVLRQDPSTPTEVLEALTPTTSAAAAPQANIYNF